MSLYIDTRRIVEAARDIETHAGRACVESLNRAAKHIVIGSKAYPGAMQLTTKATKAAIAAVSDHDIAGSVIAKMRKKGKWPATTAEIREAVKKERKRRNSAIGYLAYAGWNNAAKDVGAAGINKGINSEFGRSQAAKGRGLKATPVTLFASVENTAPASERIGFSALEVAVENAAKDLEDYLAKKISSTP